MLVLVLVCQERGMWAARLRDRRERYRSRAPASNQAETYTQLPRLCLRARLRKANWGHE